MSTTTPTVQETPDEQTRITGPYTGYDCYGNADHTYWKCEACGAEATRKSGLDDCCQ
ncbi:hypothetical protein V5735_01615 (plasmid) [Haladaptatus sp. SPP-AMP-3]|uniref:hypothetical protein n=1 Tax=Haladaptatus sp. SPP-AMP-3 TaxID=3121295 RepID=UPI003C3011D9